MRKVERGECNLQSTSNNSISSIPQSTITNSVLGWDERRNHRSDVQHDPEPNGNLPSLERSFQIWTREPEPEDAYADGQGVKLAGVTFHVDYERVDALLWWEDDNE